MNIENFLRTEIMTIISNLLTQRPEASIACKKHTVVIIWFLTTLLPFVLVLRQLSEMLLHTIQYVHSEEDHEPTLHKVLK